MSGLELPQDLATAFSLPSDLASGTGSGSPPRCLRLSSIPPGDEPEAPGGSTDLFRLFLSSASPRQHIRGGLPLPRLRPVSTAHASPLHTTFMSLGHSWLPSSISQSEGGLQRGSKLREAGSTESLPPSWGVAFPPGLAGEVVLCMAAVGMGPTLAFSLASSKNRPCSWGTQKLWCAPTLPVTRPARVLQFGNMPYLVSSDGHCVLACIDCSMEVCVPGQLCMGELDFPQQILRYCSWRLFP